MSESLLWGWNGSTGICPHEWGMWQKENSANCVLLLIFGIVLLIVWHDIKEGTVQTDDDYCSTSLIHLSRTYLIRFCGSQTGVGISAEWTFITISVIMPILRSPARNPAQTCWEYKLWLLTLRQPVSGWKYWVWPAQHSNVDLSCSSEALYTGTKMLSPNRSSSIFSTVWCLVYILSITSGTWKE